MIHLIHGEDVVLSRNYLLRLTSEFESKKVLDCRFLDKQALQSNLDQSGLFDESLLVIDWFEESFLPLPQVLTQENVIVWASGEIKDTSWTSKASIFKRKGATIFKLVDAFGLRRGALCEEYLTKVLAEKAQPDYIISMLSRQTKLISLSLSGESVKVSKSEFLQKKISDQAKLWNQVLVKKTFLNLLEADLAFKSGLDPKLVLSLALLKSS